LRCDFDEPVGIALALPLQLFSGAYKKRPGSNFCRALEISFRSELL